MKRRNARLVQLGQLVLAGQVQEHLLHIVRQRRVGREVADVGVQPGRTGVVVARRQMRITHQLAAFAPGHQQHLGMGLQAYHAVHHLRADRLQPLGVVDVGLFVESSLQFHHGCHFFAPAHGLAQQLHQL